MHGFLGTKASLLSDSTLILETIIVAGIMFGWYLGKKHRSLNHHWLMLVMVVTDVAFLILYMVHQAVDPKVLFPVHNAFYRMVYLPTVIVHSFISSAAFILGIWLAVQGIRHHVKGTKQGTYVLKPDYRPRHARMGVWSAWAYLISALSGMGVYYMLYMM
jgi:uncharacterized membrane protein YozB (DUF420 family)